MAPEGPAGCWGKVPGDKERRDAKPEEEELEDDELPEDELEDEASAGGAGRGTQVSGRLGLLSVREWVKSGVLRLRACRYGCAAKKSMWVVPLKSGPPASKYHSQGICRMPCLRISGCTLAQCSIARTRKVPGKPNPVHSGQFRMDERLEVRLIPDQGSHEGALRIENLHEPERAEGRGWELPPQRFSFVQYLQIGEVRRETAQVVFAWEH